MKKKLLVSCAALFFATTSFSQTILLEENFNNNDYDKSFPLVWDGDGLAPHSSIRDLFLSGATGSYQPWWILRDSNTSPNFYYGSHSMYSPAGESNDWMISVPVAIPETGFKLSFDAQSFCFNQDESKLSSLWLYITETMTSDPADLPTVPVAVYENVPQGDTDAVDNEFTRYVYNLDEYAGKTIYVCFVNKNYDKNILCLDNIRISRDEVGAMSVGAPQTVTDETFAINVTVSAMTEKDLTNWSVTYTDGVNTFVENGDRLASFSSYDFTFDVPMSAGATLDYTLTLSADDMPDYEYKGKVSRYAFETFRKILIEEKTGTWCGWCPAGAYNIDCMLADEEMKEYVVPVAVHATATMDPMVVDYYDSALSDLYGTSAPLFIANRKETYQINSSYDTNFDKDNTGSLAYAIRQLHKQATPAEVKVTGEYLIEGNDTTAIKARAVFRSALPVDKEKYTLSFILTENNVWMPADAGAWWAQVNNYSSKSGSANIEGTLGGWTYCNPSQVDVRYNDVARGIWDFYGIEDSLPNEMVAGEEYEFEYTITIPDTYVTNANGKVMRPAIKREYCELICFVVDIETGEVVNCDKFPMSEVAEERYTVADLVEEKGYTAVEDIEMNAADAQPAYYDLQGRKVVNPQSGIYIRKVGGKAEKVVIK